MRSTNINLLSLSARIRAMINQRKNLKKILGIILLVIVGACAAPVRESYAAVGSCPMATLNFSKTSYSAGEAMTLQGSDTSGSTYHICIYSPSGVRSIGTSGTMTITPSESGTWTGAIFVGSTGCGTTPGNCTKTVTVGTASGTGTTTGTGTAAGTGKAGLDLAYAYSIGSDTTSAVAVGLNSGLNYESTQGSGWSNLTGAGLKIISDYGDQLTRCYLFGFTGDSNLQCQFGAMTEAVVLTKWTAYLQSPLVQGNLGNIVAFNLSDDWYDEKKQAVGVGKKLFQDMTAAVHTYAPGHRSICTLTANTTYAHTAQGYSTFAAALNFSPSGCDMVGLYLYPTVNKQPLTNFTNAIAGLKINGLNPSVTPIIGIAESYNTTGAAVENEVKFMCDNGATSIGFWAYNTGMGLAASRSEDIRGGMSRGLQYCGGASSTPGTGTYTPGSGSYVPGTSSGGSGSGSYTDGGDYIPSQPYDGPAYYDPGMGVLPTDSGAPGASATAPPEGEHSPLFPGLGTSATTATATCGISTEGGGLVPCGRNTDNPKTSWNECDACDLCAFILMGQLSIEFLMEATGILAILFIIYAGFLYIFAVGKADKISKAKLMIKYILIGFVIVFTAWIVVNSILMIFGYIDPIGGSWHTVC